MPTYVSLLNWTEQGVKNFKDSVDRYESAREALGKIGLQFRDTYWTLGPYDIVTIGEAADDEAASAAVLALAGQGNVRSVSMRAFNSEEMRRVIERATG